MKTFSEFINERVVSVVQRKKQARRMAKMARSSAFQAKKRKAMLKMRTPAKLAQVARKTAIQSYRDKFSHTNFKIFTEWPSQFEIYAWMILIGNQGSLNAHMHKEGRLSGSLYINIKENLSL